MRLSAFILSALICLPGVSAEEKAIKGLQSLNGFHLYKAPKELLSGNRMAAEWEPVKGVMLKWPLWVQKEVLLELVKDDKVFIHVMNEADKGKAMQEMNVLGVDPAKVQYLVAQLGGAAPWPRDWGPHPVFCADGRFTLAGPKWFHYPIMGTFPIRMEGGAPTFATGTQAQQIAVKEFTEKVWTPKKNINVALESAAAEHKWNYTDQMLPAEYWYPYPEYIAATDAGSEKIAQCLQQPFFKMSFAMTGGNVLCDGHGTAFSTVLTLNENFHKLGLEPREVGRKAAKEMGFGRYFFIPNFEDYGIQHIDCLLKMVDEETFLMAMPPKGHRLHERYQSIAAQLSRQTSVYGNPYKVVFLDAPPYDDKQFNFTTKEARELTLPAYSNSYIINKKVFVPLFGIPQDQAALDTYRKAMPGYKVVGIPYDKGYMWYDAIHCRVRSVWDPEMLRVSPASKPLTLKAERGAGLYAQIVPYSKQALVEGKCRLFWRVDGQETWNAVPLEHQEGTVYGGVLPCSGLKPGQVVNYYFQAADGSGRVETAPRTAPGGFYSVTME